MNRIFAKKHRYRIIKSVYQDDIHTNSNGISYGIVSHADPTVRVLDISTDPKFVKNLVRKCNKGNLSPVHLMDVIEDALP